MGTGASVRETAMRRRAIRAYTAEPVSRAALEVILATAGLAPSAFNLQPWRFVIVERADVKTLLSDAAYRQRQVAAAPALIVVYTDTTDAIARVEEAIHPDLAEDRRESQRASVRREFARKTEEERENWGLRQGYIALGYLLLAAEEQGYQTSPMLGFDEEKIKSAVALPAQVRVAALVAIGRGAEEGRPHHRHPLDRIVKWL